ncbi:MAG TPA: hypothetical protein VK582_09325 [Pyrinomonadaceae bacterium]|nr:hypothetical protein [Pyrinomonadaceae bacterium]
MKTYLQRLAERAEGVSLTPPLRPTIRSEVTREARSESLVEETSFESSVVSRQTSADIPRNEPAEDATRIVEPSIQATPKISPPHQDLTLPAAAHQERPAAVEPRSAGKESVTPQQVTPARQRELPQRDIIEAHSQVEAEPTQKVPVPRRETPGDSERSITEPRRDVEAVPTRKMEVRRETPEENSAPQLSPAHSVDLPNTEKGPSKNDEYARLEQLTQDFLRRLAPPIQAIEHLAPTPTEIGAAVSDRAIPNLEPPRTDPIRQTPIPDEPRLVIGQLRVDILPTGPTETREVVRVAQSGTGARRPFPASPVSKLRFGLGQM